MEPVILTDPEPSVIPAEWPASEPTAEPSLPQPEQAVEPQRSTHEKPSQAGLKTMSHERLSQSGLLGYAA